MAVLKTVVAKATVGSNPTLSVSPQVLASGFAPVAQWIRASDYGSEGRGFESSPALIFVAPIFVLWNAIVFGCSKL